MKSSSESIFFRIAQNSAFIAASRVMMAVVTLATMPVLVSQLGLSGYGVWETILAITGLSMLWQGPLSGTLLWASSNAFGAGDHARIRELVQTGIFSSFITTLAVLPCIVVLDDALPALFHIPQESHRLVSVAIPAVFASTLLVGINESYAAAIDGCQRMGLTAAIRAGAHLAGTLASLAAVLSGWGIYSLVIGQWVIAMTSCFSLRLAARSVCPEVRFGVRIPGWRESEMLLRYAGLLLVGYVSAVCREQTDKLVLAAFARPTWVGYYTIAGRLTSVVLELCKFIYGPTVTAAGALWAKAEMPAVKSLYSMVMTWLPAALGAGVLAVGGLHSQLLILWMGRRIPEVTPIVWLLLVGNAAAAVLTGPGTAICRGIGRVFLETRYIVATLICNIALTVILVMTIGAMGTVWASAVSWAAGAVYFAFLFPARLAFPAAPAIKAGAILILSLVFAGLLHWFSGSAFNVASRTDALVVVVLLVPLSGITYVAALFALGLLPWRSLSRWQVSMPGTATLGAR